MSQGQAVVGVALVALPFVVLLLHMLVADGLAETLWVLGLTVATAAPIMAGCAMLAGVLHL